MPAAARPTSRPGGSASNGRRRPGQGRAGAFSPGGKACDRRASAALRHGHPFGPDVSSSMDPYILLLVGAGALILLVAWLPMALRELPLSLPMFCVAFGFAVFSLSSADVPHPLVHPEVTEDRKSVV